MSGEPPVLTISVAVHNALHLTKRCVEAVMHHTTDFELIVTDNASSDGTGEYLTSLVESCQPGRRVTWVKNERNIGYGPPHNYALGLAKGKYFAVLNNDLEVCQGWATRMIGEFARNPKVALVGVKGTCCMLDQAGGGIIGARPEYVEGSCLMTLTELMRAQKHGLFSEEFKFAYYEDSDLSLRMREKGYEIALVDLPIRHEREGTAREVRKVLDLDGYKARNQKVFQSKWAFYLKNRTFKQTVIVWRDGALGDVLLITPLLPHVKARWPNGEIVTVSRFPEVFRGNPYVAKSLMTPAAHHNQPFPHYDLIYNLNLAYENTPAMHVVDAYGAHCGMIPETKKPSIYPNEAEKTWAKSMIAGRKAVVIHPVPTAWKGRNLEAHKFNEIANYFKARSWRVLLVGLPGTLQVEAEVDLRGKTTLHQLAALMQQAGLFVGIDSAPMHLAVAADIPVVAAFGGISPEMRLPHEYPHMIGVVADNVGCLGCHHYLPAPRIDSGCFRDRVYCMERLPASKMIAAAETALEKKRAGVR
jgi:ADP-heptose:LPS heptosyltransferase/GT2 family glycosyltransferase